MVRVLAAAGFVAFLGWLGISLATKETDRSEKLAVELSKSHPAIGRMRHRD